METIDCAAAGSVDSIMALIYSYPFLDNNLQVYGNLVKNARLSLEPIVNRIIAKTESDMEQMSK